ncbi:MAG: amino acid permease [Deltaproteobacteria bacterium]|uniref:Amino acid permease n=1 Tax=Candidatus Zymogenus saltonus TaxID=2844893 RepID=A0A9D8KDE1_9DELT|nr:amino acid permease [Candidatus Zymogenus saltonus]
MKEEGALGLKRVLGLKEVVAIGIGQTIGAGVFAMTGIAIGMCGTALPIAYTLAIIPVACLMLPSAFLGATIPTVGGNYTYPSRLFSPLAAFMGVWIFVIGFFFGFIPMLAVTIVEYLRAYFPNLPITSTSIAIITFFYIINIFGIRLAAVIQGIMVLILISALIMYDVVGLPHVSLVNFEVLFPKGSLSLVGASALLIFPYLGANAIIELGGEIKKPERVIPVSFVIILSVVAVIYITMSVVAVGVTGWETCADKTLTESAKAFLTGIPFHYFIICGALLAITTTLNATFMWSPKSLMIVAKDGLLPPLLTRVNKKFGTPHNMLTMIWAFSIIAIICNIDLKSLALCSSIGGLFIYIPVQISALLLKKKRPEEYAKSQLKVPGWILYFAVIFGILLFLAAIASLTKELYEESEILTIFLGVWTVLGFFYFYGMKYWLKRRGVDFKETTKDFAN